MYLECDVDYLEKILRVKIRIISLTFTMNIILKLCSVNLDINQLRWVYIKVQCFIKILEQKQVLLNFFVSVDLSFYLI